LFFKTKNYQGEVVNREIWNEAWERSDNIRSLTIRHHPSNIVKDQVQNCEYRSACFYFFEDCNENHHVAKERKSIQKVKYEQKKDVWMRKNKGTDNGNYYRNKQSIQGIEYKPRNMISWIKHSHHSHWFSRFWWFFFKSSLQEINAREQKSNDHVDSEIHIQLFNKKILVIRIWILRYHSYIQRSLLSSNLRNLIWNRTHYGSKIVWIILSISKSRIVGIISPLHKSCAS